jgi:dihydroxyacetone kinase-like protein
MVGEMLQGYVAANRHLIALDEQGDVVRSTPKESGKVALVIGNGSGHEPAMVGWVGRGLFDVNVPGPIFASPGPARLTRAIVGADRGAGVLVCVSNHAGDRMNAEIALEAARDEGARAEMVILYDDVASAPRGQEPDRRGAAGLFFVWKIVGALAEAGGSLADCSEMARRTRDNTRTLSAAFGTVTHPVSGEPLAELAPDQLVIGVGVHGESESASGRDWTAVEVATEMLDRLIDDGGYNAGDTVCVLVNNGGAMTVMELSILYQTVDRLLAERGIGVHRAWIGAYATTQDMAGFALSLCRVDDEMTRLYDAPAEGAGFIMSEGTL